MKLLDLFCKAGGSAVGYYRAGFDEIVGVDIETQKHYPFKFVQADWREYLDAYGDEFDVIHASPPCQGYSTLAAMHPTREWPKLIVPVQKLLLQTGRPFVIENVETAPLHASADLSVTTLCGSMFHLGARDMYLRRHRLFQTNFQVEQPICNHQGRAIGVYGHGGHTGKHRMAYAHEAREALGIDWMTRDEMTQAIPPAYTEYIGKFLLGAI